MANISPSSQAIQAHQQTVAQLFGTFSEGMQTLLVRKDLDEQDQERLKRTTEIVQAVAKRYFETAQDVQQLEVYRQGNQLQHVRSMVSLLLSAKEKEINQAHEEFRLLCEEADFLEIHLSHLQEIEQKKLPFNRREVHLKAPHPHFTGRTALLDDIKTKLNDATPLVLYGSPGMGKTETAITFANQHLEDYVVVWTIEAATAEQQERSYRELAVALLLPILKEDTLATIRQRVHRKLEQLEKPWFLIFDNLETSVEVPQRGGHLLITARDKAPFALYKHVEVSVLTEGESFELLQKVSGETASSAMTDLAKYLGYYPLLLQQAANHIRLTPGVSIATYLRRLKTRPLAANLADITPDERYTTLFKLTLEETLVKLGPQALEWLRICAHLSPDRIPLAFLKTWAQSEKEEQAILVQLANRGLLRFDAKHQSFAMHRLYQDLLQDEGSYQQACGLLLELIEKIDLYGAIKDWDQTMSQAEVLFEHLEFIFQSAWQTCLSEQKQATGLDWLGGYYCLKGYYALALEKWEKALQIWKKIKGNQHSTVVRSLNNIGACLHSQGNYVLAIQKIEEALLIQQKSSEDQSLNLNVAQCLDVAISFNNIGNYLYSQGNYVLALQKHEVALQIKKKTLGDQHLDVANSLNNIGNCLQSQGNYVLALQKYEEVLRIQQKALGDPHPDVAGSLHNMGNCLYSQGNYALALQKYGEALQIKKKTLGDPHPDVAMSFQNIGNCLHSQGNYALALQKYEEALRIQQKALGDQHPDVVGNLNGIGNCLYSQGNYILALQKYEKALKVQKKILEDQHPDVAKSLHNIGLCLHSQGNYALALQKYEEALQIQQKALGGQHPDVAKILNNIGACLLSQRKSTEARVKFLQAYTIAKEGLGEHHLDTQLYLKNFNQSNSFCTII